MIHLEKLAFLLLIAAGAVIYVAAQGNPRVKQARAWIEGHLLWLVGGLLCIVALIGIAAASTPNFVELPVIRHLNTPPYVKVPLGLLCGALLVELTSAVKKADFSALSIGVRAVPFIFFFSIGFFSYELQQMLHYLTRIEAGGITLDFTSSDSEESQTLIPSDAAQGTGSGGGDIRTAFQLGISLFPEAFDTMANDKKRIMDWCNTFEALNCGTSEDRADAKTDPDRPLLELYNMTEAYLNILRPLQECLSGIYVDYFPNGSPIQEELSEFAAAVSIDFDDTAPGSSYLRGIPFEGYIVGIDEQNASDGTIHVTLSKNEDAQYEWSENRERLAPYLQDLQNQLARFGRYAEQYELSESDDETKNQIETCKSLEKDSGEDEAIALTVKSLTDALENINTVSQKAFSLPYVSIFEAAIIASSGYPEEAAHHMVREYEQLSSAEQQQKFGIRDGDFSEFLLQVRLLSPLEQIFAYSRDRAKQVRYAEALVKQVAEQFNKIEPFQSEKSSNFVRYCADHRLFPSGAQVRELPMGTTHREIEVYFRSLVDFYLRSYARLLDAVASDPGIFTKPDRFDRFARVAADLGSLASKEPSVLSGCITEGLAARYKEAESVSQAVNQAIDLLRYDLLAAYGFILARQADQREIDPEVAPHIDRSFKKDVTCEAQRILLQAWRLRHVAEPEDGEAADSAYTAKAYKIRRILEQINRSGVQCVTS